MSASYQHLALAEVKPGMILSDVLLDKQGQVLLPQGAVLTAATIVLLLALALGLWLSTHGGWPILVLGMISLMCAVAYTGGPFPLAYHGLGDLFVLLFFGLFAVLGTAWVQVAQAVGKSLARTDIIAFSHGPVRITTPSDRWLLNLPPEWWLVAAAVGFQATTIIAVNNQRDLITDARVGKRTLAVRLGEAKARVYYGALHLATALCWWSAALWLGQRWLFRLHLLFGLIMALGFTGAVRLGREEADNRTLFIGILGGNIAWGIVDGGM